MRRPLGSLVYVRRHFQRYRAARGDRHPWETRHAKWSVVANNFVSGPSVVKLGFTASLQRGGDLIKIFAIDAFSGLSHLSTYPSPIAFSFSVASNCPDSRMANLGLPPALYK